MSDRTEGVLYAAMIRMSYDTIQGRTGNDRLYGQKGDDHLEGGTGNDVMNGGQDADTFVFRDGYDKDTIVHFRAAGKVHDSIDLSDLSDVADFKDLKAHHMHQHGKDVVISDSFGDTLTLEHMKIRDLDETDFIIF